MEFVEQPGPHTAMGWNIAPEGLEELLVSLSAQFPGQALMVTENGAAFEDEVAEDGYGARPRAHRLPAAALRRRAPGAVARGVDLRGYFVWSLLDNFEWGYGYAKRFGSRARGLRHPASAR